MKESIQKNFLSATLNFIFIIFFVNVFQMAFGSENSIVGVVLVILMPSSLARDLTSTPVKHLLIQAFVLVAMAVSACLVTNLPPLLALPVNFLMVFFILYAYTYEYASHLYVPYILSYLFLVFISTITPAQLPKRILGMLTGAVCIILYQLVKNRRRVTETVQSGLTYMIDEAQECIRCLLSGTGTPDNPETVRQNLCKLSRIVFERRKKVLCVSDASFSMLDCGRGLEHLILVLYDLKGPVTPARAALLRQTAAHLEKFRAFVRLETKMLLPVEPSDFLWEEDKAGEEVYQCIAYISAHLLHMTDPDKRASYHKTVLSLSVRLKAALDVNPVRVVYALRVTALLAGFTLLVQLMALPHGKWLLFTLASVSLPYADDVGSKAKKRLFATLAGGLVSVAAYALIPSMAGRTAIMMLSGYFSYYFTDYKYTFACSTIGALGGAVFMDIFGWRDIGEMFVIRLGYICAGILIALLANCALFPFKRRRAVEQLWKKYAATTGLLEQVCGQEDMDPQLYYSLVIQSHLIEDKLCKETSPGELDKMQALLEKCREVIRAAHRKRAAANA